MNGEWVFLEIARWVLSLVLVYVGYFLGLRSQKMQALREYITEIVKDKYPALFHELRFNSETLDNYLEKPNESFHFPLLEEIFDVGRDEFLKTHHKDLFLMVDSFHKNILPKFYELSVGELMERLFDVSSELLSQSLPREVLDCSKSIALDLAKTINPHYIIPDLLNGRDEEAESKIEECILEKISHKYTSLSVQDIREQLKETDFDKISRSLVEKAKPEAKILVDKFKKLKKQNDEEVKEKLLPLLQKYISNPI